MAVKEPWARATVPRQTATGVFMQITAARGSKLVEVRSPAADIVEIHEMKMEGNVMKMNAVAALDLPAGRTVELKPGGYHVMLIDLKAQVKAGDKVPLTLVIEGIDGKRELVEVTATGRALTAGNPAPSKHGH